MSALVLGNTCRLSSRQAQPSLCRSAERRGSMWAQTGDRVQAAGPRSLDPALVPSPSLVAGEQHSPASMTGATSIPAVLFRG